MVDQEETEARGPRIELIGGPCHGKIVELNGHMVRSGVIRTRRPIEFSVHDLHHDLDMRNVSYPVETYVISGRTARHQP